MTKWDCREDYSNDEHNEYYVDDSDDYFYLNDEDLASGNYQLLFHSEHTEDYDIPIIEITKLSDFDAIIKMVELAKEEWKSKNV